MRSRILLLLAAGGLILSLLYVLSPKPVPVTVAVLQFTDNNLTTLDGFKQGLAAAGLQEGEEITYLAPAPVRERQQLPDAARELVRQQPDLIFVTTTPATRAVQQVTAELTPELPVVFAPVNDPVAAGIVANLQQPEANLTGIRLGLSEGRRLQALKDAFPQIRLVAVPYTPQDRAAEASLAQLQQAAGKLGVSLLPLEFDKTSNRTKIDQLIPATADAILLPREGRVMSRTRDFAAVAIARRLPLSAARFSQAEAGALTGYGFVGVELGKQAARLARQILQGTPIANLPVETARDYLFFNLDSAAEMGLEIPEATLRRAHFLIRDQQVLDNR